VSIAADEAARALWFAVSGKPMKALCVVASHPIQYQAPIFRELAKVCDVTVYFAHKDTPQDQAQEEFGVEFEWDLDLLRGYESRFLSNAAQRPGFSRFFGCDSPELEAVVREKNFDAVLVMGWNLRSYWQAVRACRRSGVPVMVRGDSTLTAPRSFVKRFVKRLAYPAMFSIFDRCLYVGKLNRQYFVHYGVGPERLFLSPHAVDNDWFSRSCAKLDKKEQRRRYGIEEDAVVVLFAGKLVDRKRPLDILYAVEGLGEDVHVVYAGSGEAGDGIDKVRRMLRVNCHLLGFRNQSEMPSVYSIADIVVLPSDGFETWGLVVNEAMACGIPAVVSSEVGCVPDLIEPGVTGYTFPKGNIEALRETLRRMTDDIVERDFRTPVQSKISEYSPHAASKGILCALESLAT
jgi:glycosyltransferase involved in cell wall biosynthesis